MTFVRKSCTLQNQLKNRTLLPAEKFGNTSTDSFIKNNLWSILYLGLKFLSWTNRNVWFKKKLHSPFRYIFSTAINVFLSDFGWRYLHHKDGCSQIAVQTLMKKTNRGEVKEIEFSEVLKK